MAFRRTILLLVLIGFSIVFAAGCASSRKVAFRRHLDAVAVTTPVASESVGIPVVKATDP